MNARPQVPSGARDVTGDAEKKNREDASKRDAERAAKEAEREAERAEKREDRETQREEREAQRDEEKPKADDTKRGMGKGYDLRVLALIERVAMGDRSLALEQIAALRAEIGEGKKDGGGLPETPAPMAVKGQGPTPTFDLTRNPDAKTPPQEVAPAKDGETLPGGVVVHRNTAAKNVERNLERIEKTPDDKLSESERAIDVKEAKERHGIAQAEREAAKK